MKNSLQELFSFNKNERRGIFLLATILVAILVYNVFKPIDNSFSSDFTEFKKNVEKYRFIEDSINSLNKHSKIFKTSYNKLEKKLKLHSFDPNHTSIEEWMQMGLSQKQAASIVKYTSKGGRFHSPEDLRRMYCLSSYECSKIIPFVLIQEDIEEDDYEADKYKERTIEYLSIDLNLATKDKLILVNGIGPSIAKGILKYRDILGGYVKLEQLKEVYHIDSAKYENIKNNFIISTDSINKININTADYYTLKRHPYISKQNAYEIVQYRNKKGKYNNIEEILKVKGVTDSLYQKIYLYFALSETNTQ
jgi:competence ComEA-like helix-hairpin-helix protein